MNRCNNSCMQGYTNQYAKPSYASSQPLSSNSQTYGTLQRRAQPGMNSASPYGYQGPYQTYRGASGTPVQPGTSALQNGGWFGNYVMGGGTQWLQNPVTYLQNQMPQGGSGLRQNPYYQNQLLAFARAPFRDLSNRITP